MLTKTLRTTLRTAAIIQARTRSSRLEGKVLLQINGKPLLKIQIDRLRHCKEVSDIIVATTGSPKDDPIVEFCRQNQIACYRGSENDVLDRYYQTAKLYHSEIIVRLTADCPLIDPRVVDDVVRFYKDNQQAYDFVATTAPPPGTFPDGMDVEVFPMHVLKRAWQNALKPSEREHVTFHFWQQPDLFRTHRIDAPEDWSHFRLTVDYQDDIAFVESLYRHFDQKNQFGDLKQIVDFLTQNARPEDYKRHAFGEGWSTALNNDVMIERLQTRRATALPLVEGEALWRKAVSVIPTGSQTFSKCPSQFVDGVAPKMLVRGRGSRVWDPDGNEYIDYTLGLGPAILGHSDPRVNQAAASAADDFSCPPLPHPMETQLAEKIISLIPCAEMVRFGKNGSDVTAGAVRLARAYTGKEVVACCGYHGWQDWFIGSTTRSLGVPKAVQKLTVPFKYNDIASLKKIFSSHRKNVAAVILEPVNFFEPKENFLEGIRDLCDENKAVLIFDEIITGFRIHMGGAQSYFGVTPDLATFGKAVANGYPLSILCGKQSIMQLLESAFFSFTFGGELPSIAAALKTIELLEEEHVIEHIAKLGHRFREEYNRHAQDLEMPYTRCIGLDFWPEYVFDAQARPRPGTTAWKTSSLEMLSLFQQEIVRRNILTRAAPFISGAHTSYDIEETLSAIKSALYVLRTGLNSNRAQKWTAGKVITPVIRAAT